MNHIHIRIVVAVLVISMFLGYNFYHFFPYVFLPYTCTDVAHEHMSYTYARGTGIHALARARGNFKSRDVCRACTYDWGIMSRL